MFKRIVILVALVGGFGFFQASEANAWVVVRRRIAPVRRLAARAVLPPYPVARRVRYGPVLRRPVIYARPSIYVGPMMYYGY